MLFDKNLHAQNGEAITRIAWSPDGTRLAVAGYAGVVEIWSISASMSSPLVYQGHHDVVADVAWSPDGVHLASGSWDGTVQIWHATTGNCEHTFGQDRRDVCSSTRVLAVAWSPDGRHLASAASDWTIRVCSASHCWRSRVLSDHVGSVECISWSSDNRHLASGGGDALLRIWDAALPRLMLCEFMPHGKGINAMTWLPSGESLAVLEAGRWIHAYFPHTHQWRWSRTHGANALLGYEESHSDDTQGDVTCSSDGSALVSTGNSGIPWRWDAASGALREEFCGGGAVCALAFHPSFRRIGSSTLLTHLATGTLDGRLTLWPVHLS